MTSGRRQGSGQQERGVIGNPPSRPLETCFAPYIHRYRKLLETRGHGADRAVTVAA